MRLKAIATLFPAVLLAAGTAAAMDKTDGKAKSFDELDKDRNGKISMLEAAALPAVKNNFKAADKDDDLSLSRQEFDDLQGKSLSTGTTAGAAASGMSTNARGDSKPGK